MTIPPNIITIALNRKMEAKDCALFRRLLTRGPITRRLDRLAMRLNSSFVR